MSLLVDESESFDTVQTLGWLLVQSPSMHRTGGNDGNRIIFTYRSDFVLNILYMYFVR